MIENLKYIFRSRYIDKKNIELIKNSSFFDEDYYLSQNPHIKGDLCTHYYYYGWKEGLSPSYNFSTRYYLQNNKDVLDSGINPLLHYLKFGIEENRTIEKDNGLSIKKLYEKIYDFPLYYKLYIENIHIKRINVFFDKIDNSIENMSCLIKKIIDFVNKNNYQLRIIYSFANFELLKSVLLKNELELPKNVELLNLKSSNYLEVGLDDIYLCTSWKCAKALLNTSSLDSKIYFYYNYDYVNNFEIQYYISKICCNSQVINIVDNYNVLEKINKYQFEFKKNKEFDISNIKRITCKFNDFFMVGIDFLNQLLLYNVFNSDSIIINIITDKYNYKFHFDSGIGTNINGRVVNDNNLTLDLYFKEQSFELESCSIQGYIKKEKCNDFNYIDISKDNLDSLLKIKKIKKRIDNYELDNLKNIILNVNKR